MSDNSGLEFLDTNILVYAHDQSAGQQYDHVLVRNPFTQPDK